MVQMPRPARRDWEAAKIKLIASQWATYGRPPNIDIRYSLRSLRSRAREQAQNNDHVRAFLRAVRINVAGPKGVRMQSKARLRSGKPDRRSRAIVEDHWQEWGTVKRPEVTERLSWPDIQRQCVETVARDGEAIYRIVRGWDGNPYRFAVQAIDPETLDIGLNETLSEGRSIVMGVELDIWRRAIAYHLRPDQPLASFYTYQTPSKETIRVPAEEIIHVYLPEWVWQTRGVPWLATTLMRLRQLGSYEEAALVGARAGASKMGFYQQDEEAEPVIDEAGDVAGGVLGDDVTARDELVENFDPGSIPVLPPGYKFEGWDPTFPSADHGPFIKAAIRSISSGLGIGYNTLANDLEGVNFSSMRQGALTERDFWMELQEWLIPAFHAQIFDAWLVNALGIGAITGPRGTPLEADRIEELARVSWQPRRWQWVDPVKETQSVGSEINLRLRSISDAIRERGRDPDEVWEELASDLERLEQLEIPLAAATAEPMPAEPDRDPSTDTGDDADEVE